jgi:hypothetical protein
VPVELRSDDDGQTVTLHWSPNPRGERPVRYQVYASDEKGFSIHKNTHNVPGRGTVPGNFFAGTENTSLVVISPNPATPSADKVFYRVVAIDDAGTRSGCSDYAELPHPRIYSHPLTQATVGQVYRYEVKGLRSLGDYQCKEDPTSNDKQYAYRFWDVEENTYGLATGPGWLTLDPQTGLLSGTPQTANEGTTTVTIEAANQFGRRAEQEFDLRVSR